MTEFNQRVIGTNPWSTTDEMIDQLIDKQILILKPGVLDDDIDEALNEWDNRDLAIRYLIEKLTKMLAE